MSQKLKRVCFFIFIFSVIFIFFSLLRLFTLGGRLCRPYLQHEKQTKRNQVTKVIVRGLYSAREKSTKNTNCIINNNIKISQKVSVWLGQHCTKRRYPIFQSTAPTIPPTVKQHSRCTLYCPLPPYFFGRLPSTWRRLYPAERGRAESFSVTRSRLPVTPSICTTWNKCEDPVS